MQVQSSFPAPNDGCGGHGVDDDDDDDDDEDDDDDDFPILLKMTRQTHQSFNHKSLILNKFFVRIACMGYYENPCYYIRSLRVTVIVFPDILGHYEYYGTTMGDCCVLIFQVTTSDSDSVS